MKKRVTQTQNYRATEAAQFDLMKRIESQAGLNGVIPYFADHAIIGYFRSAPSRNFTRLKFGY